MHLKKICPLTEQLSECVDALRPNTRKFLGRIHTRKAMTPNDGIEHIGAGSRDGVFLPQEPMVASRQMKPQSSIVRLTSGNVVA